MRLTKRSGIIYSNPTGWKRYLFYLGNILLVLALGFLAYIYQPIIAAQIRYRTSDPEVVEIAKMPPSEISIEETETEPYRVIIPKIFANSEVVVEVSPFDRAEYLKVLENNSVAMSKTSDLPGKGKGGMSFLFAHSTEQNIVNSRNNAVFYLLGELAEGDPIFIKKGEYAYTYIVYKKEVVAADEIEYLTYRENDKEIVILQTCWPLGTNWKRLLVFAQRKDI